MALQTQKQDTALQPTRTRYSFATNKNKKLICNQHLEKKQLCNQSEQDTELRNQQEQETALQPTTYEQTRKKTDQ